MVRPISTLGKYLMLMGRVFARPERIRMYFKQYINEMVQLGINSIGIVLLISFFIGAVICIQIKLNIESPWMPRFVVGYTTREILLLEFSSSIMCLILAGKVGSNIASEIGTMRVTQQIDALEIMGINSASYLILPKILGLMTIIPLLVIFSIFAGIIGAFCTAWFAGIMNATDLEYGLQYCFIEWYIWCSFIKSLFFAFIIASVSAYFGYTVEGGSIAVGKASTDSVVSSSVLIPVFRLNTYSIVNGMIQINSIYKSFEERTVLNDISFTFENGKTNLIIGQSGSGKTVLMKCLVGLLTPEKGEVLYDGRNLINMGKKEKKALRTRNGNESFRAQPCSTLSPFWRMSCFRLTCFPTRLTANVSNGHSSAWIA